jgi:hypothetical protein
METQSFSMQMLPSSSEKNSIAFLHNSAREKNSDHSGKAALLWAAFIDRLGISELGSIDLDLSMLAFVSVITGIVNP